MASVRPSPTTSALGPGKPSPNGFTKNGISHSSDGSNGGGLPPSKQPPTIPHINDLVAAPKDIDPNTSIKRLLEMAEQSLQQAESSRAFGRPAIALKDFVRASIICVSTVTRHQDYVNIRDRRSDLGRVHRTLLAKINDQHELYETVKQSIIADNRKTGVKPSVGQSSSLLPSHKATQSLSISPNNRMTPPNSRKKAGGPGVAVAQNKPPVHPKPPSLHGKALQPGHSLSSSTRSPEQDLEARLHNLHGPQQKHGHDSRINNSVPLAPVVPKPQGPRKMPPNQPSKINIDTATPALPRAPDAIYSPARASISSESSKMPSSSSNLPFHRTASSAGLASTPGPLQRQQSQHSQQSNGYFPMHPETSGSSTAGLASKTKLPDSDSIAAHDLYTAMKEGTVLVIDIRNRDEFNSGHIMAAPVMCIEPSVLLRPGISASDISESLVLAPDDEQRAFNKRDEFDLVVFYDQNSEYIPKFRKSSDDEVIVAMRRALVDFNYDKPLKSPPRLLCGGLEGWIDLMGPNALRIVQPPSAKGSRPAGSGNMLMARRSSRYRPPQWKARDVEKWKETIHHEEEETASKPKFYSSTAEFMNRYPAVSTTRESMISSPAWPAYGTSHQNDLTTDMPTPPARPAPALSRPSHSGVASEQHQQGNDEAPAPTNSASKQWTGRGVKDGDTSLSSTSHFYTGLRNPGNWCYANSIMQSLLVSRGFGDELVDTKCAEGYQVPRKPNEKIDNPQLLMRIMSNLLHWMSSGKFEVMQADTLMKYCRHVDSQIGLNSGFGGAGQQDADEFLSFLLDQLDDETNVCRDQANADVEGDQPSRPTENTLLQAGKEYWDRQQVFSQSIVDKYWRGVELQTNWCSHCSTRTYRFMPFTSIRLPLAEFSGHITMERAISHSVRGNEIPDFQCDSCIKNTRNSTHRTSVQMTTSFLRMPDLLRVSLQCYDNAGNKLHKNVYWDFDNEDFTNLTLDESRQQAQQNLPVGDKGFEGPFRYQCIAVVLHKGQKTTSGHYIAYVRDRSQRREGGRWLRCNDSNVTEATVKGPSSKFEKDRKEFSPYLAFFQRIWA